MSPANPRFAVASGLPPSADEASGVTTPGRSGRHGAAQRGPEARAPHSVHVAADGRAGDHTRQLDAPPQTLLRWPKLDRSEMLAALVGLADDNPAVFGALIARMQEDRAS